MDPLPIEIYSAADVGAIDRRAIEELGVPGYTLMQRAGEAAMEAIDRRYPGLQSMLVMCGGGNNAGDGLVVARLARERGVSVAVVSLSDPERLGGDAARAYADFEAGGGRLTDWPVQADDAALIVDALLGTGLDRDVEGRYREAIEACNAAGTPLAALDIPSGLDADTGQVRGVAIRAALTVSFVALKPGLFLGDAPRHRGRLQFSGLGLPAAAREGIEPVLLRLDRHQLEERLPPRSRDAHKGNYGHVLVVGGGPGMPGAVRLASEAALRSGAGLVSAAVAPEHVNAIVATRPELMCRGVREATALDPLLERASVVALGPGLGQSDWSRALFERALASGLPLVVDADGLNLLAAESPPPRREDWILTPHPGEAARLLDSDTAAVQRDRPAAAVALAERYGGVAVLKGAGTLVAGGGGPPAICIDGNPGMAAPGMGDVLTGIVAALRAQGYEPARAAELGVLAHALAGDEAARAGERGMLASDLVAELRQWMNPRHY